MNKVILSGNLCHDIELKQTPSGKNVTTNTLAVQREFKAESGNYESDFINIVAWGVQAEYLSRYAHKGDRAELVGRWQVRKYAANDGTQRTVNECIVESIRAYNRQPKAESAAPSFDESEQPRFEEITDENLPF